MTSNAQNTVSCFVYFACHYYYPKEGCSTAVETAVARTALFKIIIHCQPAGVTRANIELSKIKSRAALFLSEISKCGYLFNGGYYLYCVYINPQNLCLGYELSSSQ